MQNFSNKIKCLRDANNLSQERFGSKVGVSGKTISAYETGKSKPSLKVLESISKVFHANLTLNDIQSPTNIIARIDQIQTYINEIKLIINDNELSL